MQVSKWGNSLAVRLPAPVVAALRLKAGDEIEIRIAADRDFVVERKPGRAQLIDKIRQMSTPLPEGFRYSREDANAR